MSEKLRNKDRDRLYEAILMLESIEECYELLDDLCTIAEIKAMTQRFQVATMLKSGMVYSEIVEQTGASTATISRVNRCLEYGKDGYSKALARLEKKGK